MRVADPALRERRRSQILEAAGRVFLVKGFHQTRMTDLAEASGMSMGLLYRYFSSKEDIITQFAERDRELALRRIEAFEAADDWPSALDVLLRPVVDEAFDGSAALTFEVLAEAGRNPKVLKQLRRDDQLIRQGLTRAIEARQRRGTMSTASSPSVVAELVLSLFDGLLGRAQLHPEQSRRALHQAVRVFLVAALAPAVAVRRR